MDVCERCGYSGPEWQFNTHHKDRDKANGASENLERLCIPCHRKEHAADGPKNGGKGRTPLLTLRVAEEMKARWQAAADDAGYSLSEFIRACVNEVIGREAVVTATTVPLSADAQSRDIAARTLPSRREVTPDWKNKHRERR